MELRCARGTVLALLEDLGYDVASFSSREIDTFCRQINDMSHMNSEPKTAAVPLKSRSVHNAKPKKTDRVVAHNRIKQEWKQFGVY